MSACKSSSKIIDSNTEIRKMPPANFHRLAQILQDSWRKLMAIIKTEDEKREPMFTADQMKLIEYGSRQLKKLESEVFLEEWSTIGRKRPTCKILLDYLVEAQLFRAADYLAINVLKIDPPERPKFGPAAKIEIDDKILSKLLNQQAKIDNTQQKQQKTQLDTWSLNYREGTATAALVEQQQMPHNVEKFIAEDKDLINFSQSDLIKFSKTENIIKDSDDNFVLQVADSLEIPNFVPIKNYSSNNNDDIVTKSSSNKIISLEASSLSSSLVDATATTSHNKVMQSNTSDNDVKSKQTTSNVDNNYLTLRTNLNDNNNYDIIPVCVIEMGKRSKDESEK